MADHAHSMGAPTRALLPFVFRPSTPVNDPRSADELLEEIAREIERQANTPEHLLPSPAPLLPLQAASTRRRAALDTMHLVEPDTAAEARHRHMRLQANAALEWGFAFLDALDLGPAALDVIDGAIAEMDRDDGDADFEPWLAGYPHFAAGCTASALDAEDDSEENEGTALESFGKGFVRAGADDAEDDDPAEESDPAERDDDHGTEDEPSLWRFERPDAVQRAAWLCEVARHV